MFTVIDYVYGSQLLCPILLLAPPKNLDEKFTIKNYSKNYRGKKHLNLPRMKIFLE